MTATGGLSPREIARVQGRAARFLTATCVINRGGADVATVAARVQPYVGEVQATPGPGSVPVGEVRWLAHLPAGTDVRHLDRLTIGGTVYAAIEILAPRTIELDRQVVCYQVALADGSLAYLHANATVTCLRGGQQVGGARRVQVAQAVSGATTPEGIPVPDLLYDVPDADWRTGDQATIVTIDGHTVAPRPRAFTVGVVRRVPAPLALTEVQLRGVGGGLNG